MEHFSTGGGLDQLDRRITNTLEAHGNQFL
jgi:hypothetical protein